MEYQLISDWEKGKRLRMNDEHALMAKWFNDELALAPELVVELKVALEKNTPELTLQGREMFLQIERGEVRIQSHQGLYDADISAYEDDQLSLCEHGLEAGAGLDDFKDVFFAWLAFR